MVSNSHFAIEISSSAVKLLGLQGHKKGGFFVTHVSRLPYDSKQMLAPVVKKALTEAGLESGFAATSVWASTMVIRKISLPKLKPQEVAGALQLEADKYVPFGLDECELDHYLFPPDPQGAKTDVMMVASKKDLILERCKFLEDMGLKLLFMDIHPLALTNWLLLRKPEVAKGVHALIHIGDAPGKLSGEDNYVVILKDGVPWVIRDLGERLSSADAADEAYAQTAALVSNAIVFFENMAREKPRDVLLSADEAVFAKLSDAIEKAARLKPARWQAGEGLEFASDAVKSTFKTSETAFAASLGVCARISVG